MQFPQAQPIWLHVIQLISNTACKKTLKKNKPQLFHLIELLGSQSESFFLLAVLLQIDFEGLTPLKQEIENPSQIKSLLFLQRIEILQDRSNFFEICQETIEEFSIISQQTPLESALLIINSMKPAAKTQILLIFSLFSSNKTLETSQIREILIEKLSDLLDKSQEKPLKILFTQDILRDFIEKDTNLEVFRRKYPGYFVENSLQTAENNENYNENPLFERFKSMDFCLKPSELLEDYSGNPQGIVTIFPKTSFDEQEVLKCLGTFAKHYPRLEDSTQRFVNQLFENLKENPEVLERSKVSLEKNSEKKTINCNIEGFLGCFSGGFPIKWQLLLRKLDHNSLKTVYKDAKSLINFLKLVHRTRKQFNLSFPQEILLNKWSNKHSQIAFLQNVFTIGLPELVSFNEMQSKRIIPLDFNPNLKFNTLNPLSLQFWCCIDLLEILIESSEGEHYFKIRSLFDMPLSKCPDILIIGLSQIKPRVGLVFLEELFSNLFPLYLLNHSNSIPILETLWKFNEKLMIDAIFSLYKKENSSLNLSRVLDITQEIKDSLIPLTNSTNLSFSVSLGILASKREFLHFEHWLSERIKQSGNAFIFALMKYIEENVIVLCEAFEKTQNSYVPSPNNNTNNNNNSIAYYMGILEKAQLSLETLGTILENLLGSGFEKLTAKNQKKAKELYAGLCKYYPLLSAVNESSFLEIETAANNNFQKVYSKEIKVEEFVEMLQKLKNSNNPSDKEIHACMLRYLFDEFRHHEEYSTDLLQLTGSIFGNLIATKFLDGSALLGLALECVRYSIEKGSTKRLAFAKEAISCFRKRLFDLFEFFQSLFYIDVSKDKIPELLLEIYEDSKRVGKLIDIKPDILYFLYSQRQSSVFNNYTAQNMKQPTIMQKPNNFTPQFQIPSSQPQVQPNYFLPMQQQPIQPLQQPPPIYMQQIAKNAQQPIVFNQNNAAQPQNYQTIPTSQPQKNQKKLSLQDPKAQNLPFDSQANANILDILKENNEEIEAPDEEIQNKITFHLNNLSSNNMAEKANELLKLLELQDSIKKWFARMLVCKRVVQETLTKNNYLQLLNTLQMSNLNKFILKETYTCIHKLLALPVNNNDKSAIQIKNFLKNLGFWLGHVTLARNKPITLKQLNLKQLLIDAFANNRLSIVLPFICKVLEGCKISEVFVLPNPWVKAILVLLSELLQKEDVKTTLKQEIKLLFNTLSVDISQLTVPVSESSLSNEFKELDFIKIPAYLQSKFQQIDFKDLANKVFEKSIAEVLGPIVSRTVTIAMHTGKRLVFKDFSFESSDNKVEEASLLIIQNLANALALACTREPLQGSINNYLRKEISENIKEIDISQEEFEEISNALQKENIENACKFIQKKVLEKTLSEIAQDNEIKHAIESRKQGTYQPEETIIKEIECLPAELKPDFKGLRPEEMNIYEGFSIENNVKNKETETNEFLFYNSLPMSLENLADELNDAQMNEIIQNYKSFLSMVKYSEQQTLNLCVKYLELYFKKGKRLDSILKIELLLIKSINNQAFPKKFMKEIKNFLINLPDTALNDSRFNENLLISLFNCQLLSVKKIDKICGCLVRKPLQNLQNAIVKTLSHLIFTTKQISPKNILLSWVALGNLGSCNETVMRFLDSLNKFSNFSLKMSKKGEIFEFLNKKTQLHEKIQAAFQEYLVNFFKKAEAKLPVSILEFEKFFFSEGEDIFVKSLVILMDFSANHAKNSVISVIKLGILDIDFTIVDALVELLAKLFSQSNEKSYFFEFFLESFEIAVIHAHNKQEKGFNQRPYLRLISGFIGSMKDCLQGENLNNNKELLLLFLKKLLEMTPNKLPAFVIAWTELIGNNTLVPLILQKEELQYNYHLILCEFMKFFKKLLADEDIKRTNEFKRLYLASLKIMLVLLHDFPEFLAMFSFSLCNEIPDCFLQIKNIVLAAFPKNMRLIDPFQMNEMHKLEAFQELPKIFFNDFEEKISELNFHVDIFEFLNSKNEQLYNKILEKFLTFEGLPNHSAINSFVIGVPWILLSKQARSAKLLDKETDSHYLILQIAKKANFEIREVIFNAILNQIRFPNILTKYFIELAFLFFYEKNSMATIHEHLARVIVERLINEKPHPWGLMYLFIELIRNANYGFKDIFPDNVWKGIMECVFKSHKI